MPVFEEMLASFPFEVKGFHSDNESAELLNQERAKV